LFPDNDQSLSPEFQSPCGVLGVCRALGAAGLFETGIRVSVPLRGFRGLQDYVTVCEHILGDPVFQSPCGVLGVCRHHAA